VYCVLNPLEKIQFARVYRTYDVEGTNPLKNTLDTQVSDIEVTIDDGVQHVVFKDTVVKRDSYDRYTSDIVAYYTSELRIEPGMTYKLQVKTRDRTLAATAAVPRSAYIIVNDGAPRLIDSSLARICNCIRIRAQGYGGSSARGYLFRLYIEYTRNVQGGMQYLRKEVPVRYLSAGGDSLIPVYPGVDRSATVGYLIEAFSKVFGQIIADSSNKISGAMIITYSLDPNLYNYYQIAHGFGDPFSVRLDAPDFTNIQGGYGVFGAVTVDSLFIPKDKW